MGASAKKEVKELVNVLLRAGWTDDGGRKHRKLVYKNGRKLIVSTSPSDWRTVHNLRSQARRIERLHRPDRMERH